MRKFKENLEYLQLLLENKDHLIDQLNLTPEQKEELKAFFKSHPNYENKIDWNNKALTYEDFKSVLALKGKSKNQAKKKGVSGLKEGTDYKIIGQGTTVSGEFGSANWEYTVYMPLTHLGSKTLASPATLPVITGEWCISMNDDTWWQNYTARTMDFFFILITEKGNPQNGYKFAVSRNSSELVSNLKQYGLEDVKGNLSLKDFPKEVKTRYNLGKFWDDPSASAVQRALVILDNSIDIFTAKDQCFSLFQLYCLPNDLFSSQLMDRVAWLALEGVIDKHLNDFLRVENEHTKRIASEKDYWLARMFNLNGTLNKDAVNNLGAAYHSMQFTIDLKFPGNYPYKFFPEENTVEAELFDGTWDPDYDEFRGVSNTDLWLGSIKKIDMSQVRQVHSIMEEAFANLPFEEFIPPASLQYIGTDAFTGCTGIKLLDFLKSKSLVVESLAFSYMYNLTTILFPHQLSLGSKVFNMTTGLKDIWYDGTLSEFLDTFTEVEEGQVQETDLKAIITYLFGGAYRGINAVIHCKDKRLTLNGAEIWEAATPKEKLNLLKKKKQQEEEEEDEDAIPF